jgi:hypothetical protein
LTVDGNNTTSGNASSNTSLSVGDNVIDIVITAEDGSTQKTYTITINRQSAPIPTPDPQPEPDDGKDIEVDVIVDDEDDGTDNQTAAKVVINRKEEDGKIKDNIEFDKTKADETVKKALETENHKAIIQVKQVQGKEADESEFTLKKESVEKLSENDIDLTIESDNAKLDIPKDTLEDIKSDDIKINIRKIDDPVEEKHVDEMIASVVSGSKKIGTTIAISTNFSSRTKIFVPLKNVDIPTTQEEIDTFVAPLAVFVEHSDGDTKVDKGEVAYDEDGNPTGINIWVDKFSNFSIIGLPLDNDPDPQFSGQSTYFETNFLEDKSFVIKFNKSINEDSFNDDNIYIYDCFKNKVPLTIDFLENDRIKITPDECFETCRSYYLYLTHELLAADDTHLSNDKRYKFDICSYELPEEKFKEYDDVALDKDWTIRFNRSIDEKIITTCDIELFDEEKHDKEFEIELSDSRSIKIIPKTDYEPGETYYLVINNAKLNGHTDLNHRTWIKFNTINSNPISRSFDLDEFNNIIIK